MIRLSESQDDLIESVRSAPLARPGSIALRSTEPRFARLVPAGRRSVTCRAGAARRPAVAARCAAALAWRRPVWRMGVAAL